MIAVPSPDAGTCVGFIGLGNMGAPMAANLARAGFDVIAFDADPARAAAWLDSLDPAAAGDARVAGSLAELGGACDRVVTMLPTGAIVRDVLLGADGDGLAAHLARGGVVIDMSSSDPTGTRALVRELAGRGIALVDAPVSGLVPKARAGTLTIMIGADDPAAVERAEPVLRAMGERLILVGRAGCGHAMKALNNVVAATAFTITAEALIVGQRFGLDPAVMVDVLKVSSGRTFHADTSFPDHVLTRRFASGFTLGLLAKDVGIAAALADELRADAPLVELVSRLWAEGRDDLGPGEDNSAIVRRWERRNGVTLAPGNGAGDASDAG